MSSSVGVYLANMPWTATALNCWIIIETLKRCCWTTSKFSITKISVWANFINFVTIWTDTKYRMQIASISKH